MNKKNAQLHILNLYTEEKIQFKNIVEFCLLITNKKKVIRLVGKEELYTQLKIIANLMAWKCIKSDFMLQTVRSTSIGDAFQIGIDWDNNKHNDFVIYIGEKTAVFEAKTIESDECSALDTARIYGYPVCCGTHYQVISDGRNWIKELFDNAQDIFYDYQSNKIASLFQPYLSLHQDYFPCSIDCVETLTKCHNAENALIECGLSELLPMIKSHLSGIYLLYNDVLWCSRSYSNNNDTLFSNFKKIGYLNISVQNDNQEIFDTIEIKNNTIFIYGMENNYQFINGQNDCRLVIFR